MLVALSVIYVGLCAGRLRLKACWAVHCPAQVRCSENGCHSPAQQVALGARRIAPAIDSELTQGNSSPVSQLERRQAGEIGVWVANAVLPGFRQPTASPRAVGAARCGDGALDGGLRPGRPPRRRRPVAG